jgi:LuxR family maltose regulon positive regulatory protein
MNPVASNDRMMARSRSTGFDAMNSQMVPSGPGRPGFIERPVLLDLLDTPGVQFTVVIAPAGSGKTVLVRSWLRVRELGGRGAWVSVEREEHDPQRFWSALSAEVGRAAGRDVGLAAGGSSPTFHAEALIARILQDLTTLRAGLTLVIDDVHEIRNAEILSQLSQFLDHLPTTVRVVLISRHDLPLGLHRRRLVGDVAEIRIDELRFSIEESRELLAGVGVTLSAEGLRLLHTRTEGWAAGLRLAAVSLVAHPDPERFVREFSGSERTVGDYLLAEVLDQQTPEVRKLLMRTSILDRVNGPLADLLTGEVGTERTLRALAAAGSFVLPLDSQGEWFRFHHLFADLCAAQLRHWEAQEVPRLHLLAAGWYEKNGDVVQAILHALAADERDLVANLLVENYLSLLLDGRQATARLLVNRAAGRAPTAELAVLQAADELVGGSLEQASAQLSLAERRSDDVPDHRRQRFDVLLHVTRLTLARRVGDLHSVLDAAPPPALSAEPETAQDLTIQTDVRAWLQMNQGIVEVWTGRLEEGEAHLLEAAEMAARIKRPYLQAGSLAHRAHSLAWRAPRLALPVAQEAVAIVESNGLHDDPIAGVAYVALGSCLIDNGEVAEAQRAFDRAERTLRSDLEPAVGFLLQTGHGLVHLVSGRPGRAIDHFRAAEKLGRRLVVSSPLALQATCAILYSAVLAGDDVLVEESLAELTDSERDTVEVREVLAARALAAGDARGALAALQSGLDDSLQIHRGMFRIRLLLLDASARYLLADEEAARRSVERALDLAEDDGLILPFLWIRSAELLDQHPRHQTAHGAFLTLIQDVLAGRDVASRGHIGAAHSELSETELRVLRYLPSNLTVGEIAQELFLSINTVKTHLRSVYTKLDAHNRGQAVEAARRMGMLGRPAPLR